MGDKYGLKRRRHAVLFPLSGMEEIVRHSETGAYFWLRLDKSLAIGKPVWVEYPGALSTFLGIPEETVWYDSLDYVYEHQIYLLPIDSNLRQIFEKLFL